MDERPTLQDLIEDLLLRGGEHRPWYEVSGARVASVLRAAVESGDVEITADGGLRLADEQENED
ncbi:MAG TPA: hypothetical protein PKI52_15065 [Aggregatilineales bacterium]|nr:hypothetical protein [Aggregatilineales bacterium]